jgi:hypothetical protein
MYGSVDQLKRELGISDASQDDYLTDVLDGAAAWIDSYTNQTFATDDTEITELHELVDRMDSLGRYGYDYSNRPLTLNPTYLRSIWLRHNSITSITEVKYRYLRSDDWTVLDADSYEWSYLGEVRIPYAANFISVTYNYKSDGIPAAIALVAVQLAAKLYRNMSVTREKLGDYLVEYKPQDIAAGDELKILDRYRVRNI